MQRRTLDSGAPKGALRTWMTAAIAVLVVAPAFATQPAPGSIAPDFALKGIDGRNIRLSEYRGEPVILLFWASWCGPCRESAASLDALATSSTAQVMGVNLDGSADRARAIAASLHLQYPTLVDTQQTVARAYDVAKLPLTLLLDADGAIRGTWSGVVPNPAELTLQLDRLRQP